jgi:hypothetical protein
VVTRFYDIDAANATLPEVRDILSLLAEHRLELIRLRDRVLELQNQEEAREQGGAEDETVAGGEALGRRDVAVADEKRLRLRMQGIIDQMQASAARLEELSITLRDIQTGLIDFPALVSGRQICLCWRLGEDRIEWWHELSEGFGGRRRLSDLA